MLEDVALEEFLLDMIHAPCIENINESTNTKAFKIDDADGLACYLGFHSAMLSKVDYFRMKGDKVQLIELSDMQESAMQCLHDKQNAIAREVVAAGLQDESELPARVRKKIRKAAWSNVVNEFNRKWSGSIAVIERLYRKNGVTVDNHEYKMLIVCKNSTDARILDDLLSQLSGMMGVVNVCNSQNTNEFVLK
jgi:hypothetical protein